MYNTSCTGSFWIFFILFLTPLSLQSSFSKSLSSHNHKPNTFLINSLPLYKLNFSAFNFEITEILCSCINILTNILSLTLYILLFYRTIQQFLLSLILQLIFNFDHSSFSIVLIFNSLISFCNWSKINKKYEQPLGIAEHEQLKHRKKNKKIVSNEQKINTQKIASFAPKSLLFSIRYSLDFILFVACLFVIFFAYG